MKKSVYLSLMGCCFLVVGYFVLVKDDSPIAVEPDAHVSQGPSVPLEESKTVFALSPIQKERQERLESRRQRMRESGYDTPIEYFDLEIAKLKELGQRGNVFALIQLGDQYLNEPELISGQPGFEFNKTPEEIGLQYLSRAAMAGATQPILTIAMRLAQSNSTEAYAWALLGEKLKVPGAIAVRDRLRPRLSNDDVNASTVLAEKKLVDFSLYSAQMH